MHHDVDRSTNAFDYPYKGGRSDLHRHEIDYFECSFVGLKRRFKNQGVSAVALSCVFRRFCRSDLPMAIVGVAQ
jgi:hypothetical protein